MAKKNQNQNITMRGGQAYTADAPPRDNKQPSPPPEPSKPPEPPPAPADPLEE